MAQAPTFDLKLAEGKLIHFEHDTTFENFVGQFQSSCPKLLCVVDGAILRYYEKHGDIPTKIRFDYKQTKNGITEYYFRDIENDSLYCVFGRNSARVFYPRIDEVDPNHGEEPKPRRIEVRNPSQTEIDPLSITIIDSGMTLKFPNHDYAVKVSSHSIFNT